MAIRLLAVLRKCAGATVLWPRILSGSLVVFAVLLSGCQTVSYYKQAVQGQCEILSKGRPIAEVISDPKTPPELARKLALILELRAFAERDLNLPAHDHYLRYADLKRRFVVWNVHATPEFSLEPKTWWYPIVGSLKYRGYFLEGDARRYAEKLRRKGLDVYVEGVEAYSTLGWFDDPVLNTFIHHEPPDLAEIIFHELAHQRLFARGDTDFNEAFATAAAQEGVRRWLHAEGDLAAQENYLTGLRRNADFVRLVMTGRRRLEGLYRTEPSRPGRSRACLELHHAFSEQKQRVIDQMRREYEQLRIQWGSYRGFDRWFAQPLNNAQLNTVATYYELVPAFEQLLRANGGDLETFYRKVRALDGLSKEERRQALPSVAN